jgi:hypothetical protein
MDETDDSAAPEVSDTLLVRVRAAIEATTAQDGWRWWDPAHAGLLWNAKTTGEAAAGWSETTPGAVWVDVGDRSAADAVVIVDLADGSREGYRCYEIDARRCGLDRRALGRMSSAADTATSPVHAGV